MWRLCSCVDIRHVKNDCADRIIFLAFADLGVNSGKTKVTLKVFELRGCEL